MKRARTFIPIFVDDKPKKLNDLQREIGEQYEYIIERMDKLFEKEFGKMCPEFEPGCVQCKANLIYNKFKQELFDEFVK